MIEKQSPTVPVRRPETMSFAVSDAQLAANRANAQLSCGPVSDAGKAVSSQNNFRHGLSVASDADEFRVIATESQAAYDQHLADFRAEWKPETATEHDLVNRMVSHQWLRLRALTLQDKFFDTATGELSETKKFDLFRRYETSHERSYNKALGDIMRLRAFKTREQNGFESERRKNAEHEAKIKRLKVKANLQEVQMVDKLAAVNLKIAKTFSAAKTAEALKVAQSSAAACQNCFAAQQTA
jgi:hypothetical protein